MNNLPPDQLDTTIKDYEKGYITLQELILIEREERLQNERKAA